MSRNAMVAGAVAAVVAIVLGARLGRDLLSNDDAPAKPARTDIVHFHETVADVSLSYPKSWTQVRSEDPEIPLLVLSPDRATALQMRRSVAGVDNVTRATLPVAKKLTDSLFGAIDGAKLLEPARPVALGGLLGWRYRYTIRGKDRARDHYFLFRGKFLIAVVFEVKPAGGLARITPQLDRIMRSARAGSPA